MHNPKPCLPSYTPSPPSHLPSPPPPPPTCLPAPGVSRLLGLLSPSSPGGGLMWRSSAGDVAGDMGLPPQYAHTTRLRLSAIERHWYNR